VLEVIFLKNMDDLLYEVTSMGIDFGEELLTLRMCICFPLLFVSYLPVFFLWSSSRLQRFKYFRF